MGKGYQSIPAFAKDPGSLQDAMGVTQFASETSWAQIIGGLQIQGGLLTASGAVEFHAPYETQVLGVFVNNGDVTSVTLTGFTSSVAGYWWAIGV
jgi:hypothetical protein